MDILKHSISYGKKTIEFELHRKNVKNINLNVKPDMTVVVSADRQVPLEYINDFVKCKASWILKNIGYFKTTRQEQSKKKEYVSGETFKYLGKQYRLKVEETDDKEHVKYYQGYIYLKIKDKNNYNQKEKLLTQWFKDKAKINFTNSLERIYLTIKKYGIEKPDIQIRLMKARWGSADRDKKRILLNYELFKAPKYCIDYVVLHELIHFLHKNHDKKFYDLLTVLMPDWKMRKEILDEEIVREV